MDQNHTNISNEVNTLCKSVVQEYFPDELSAYDLSGEVLINKLSSSEGLKREINQGKKGVFKFIEETNIALEFVGVALSIYELVRIQREKKKSKSRNLELLDTSDLWKEKLVQEGITEEMAEKIVSKFTRDVISILQK